MTVPYPNFQRNGKISCMPFLGVNVISGGGKMVKIKSTFCFILLILLFSSGVFAGRSETDKTIRVFVVHSYEDNHVCGIPQGRGIESVLKNAFSNVIIKRHFMDTKTKNSSRDKMKKEGKAVLAEIETFSPDIVFTIDDNAFREVGLLLEGKPFPVVFSGMNGQPEVYNRQVSFLNIEGKPVSNITGVYEKLHLMTALSVIKGVKPDLKHVVALLDKSPTGYAIKEQMKKEVAEAKRNVNVSFRQVGTVEEFLNEIKKINVDDSVQVVYPVVLSIKDASGKSIGFKHTIKTFIQESKKPGMALNFAFANLGLFGGASVDFEAMGRQTGTLGVRLLKKEKISEIPIESASEYLITFNIGRSKMLGITIPDEIIGAATIYNDMKLLPDYKH